MNSILLSIRPEWLAKILNGKKTYEVRTKPIKEGTKVYGYCTKGKPYLYQTNGYLCYLYETDNSRTLKEDALNGLVVCEFIVGKCEKITSENADIWACFVGKENKSYFDDRSTYTKELGEKSCLTEGEMAWYGRGCHLYAWHISQLKVYDKPKELGEFHKVGFNEAMKNWEYDRFNPKTNEFKPIPCPAPQYEIKKAPQSYCFVEEVK